MTFLEILILMFFLVLSIVVIRISFQFNINDYLKDRRAVKINQLKNICPHTTVAVEDEQIVMGSLFKSPVGTTKYICSQCGLIVDSKEDAQKLMGRYAKNPEQILEDQKKFRRKAKKLKCF
ncbi:hypothetical protein H6501_05480 [Candidatus Woesearchaeota archaeon]|nr:hypothetical protein [Candidatus Woesearchaeota archaeon]USN44255.1 MAG: hypothetical protein H6500_00200 [Candidatus Woesearchaeota archaeon]